MAADERNRVGYFRQRWAQENFESQQSVTSPENAQSGDDIDLSTFQAQSPVASHNRVVDLKKRSWRDTLRLPGRGYSASNSGRLTPSQASTSLRSPVDSQNNTIYSSSNVPPAYGQTQDQSNSTMPKPPRTETSSWLMELFTLSWLIFFSLLGMLARVGIEALTEYPNAPVTSRVLWANTGGSFTMGFLIEDRHLFGLPAHLASPAKDDESPDEPALSAAHLKHKKTIPLYIGLTTGFCGSFTSFSSFIRDAFLALTNALPSPSPTTPYHAPTDPPHHRSGGFSLLALLAILILHPALSLAALHIGKQTAHGLRTISPTTPKSHPLLRPHLTKLLDYSIIPLALLSWLIASLFLTIFPPSTGPSPTNYRARATIPLLLSPPGCILRYYLAKHLNQPSTAHFPLGTFAANIFGTLVLGMAWDLQHARGIGAVAGAGSGAACAVLEGVMEGFCGCLTTVSTWVAEMSGLGAEKKLRWAWVYGATSVGVGLAGLVMVMGGMGWTIGFQEPVCG